GEAATGRIEEEKVRLPIMVEVGAGKGLAEDKAAVVARAHASRAPSRGNERIEESAGHTMKAQNTLCAVAGHVQLTVRAKQDVLRLTQAPAIGGNERVDKIAARPVVT